MANIAKWSNVGVSMQSALGSALTITAITKADPGVVTSTGHGLSNGDYILLEVGGMYQLTNRVFRVANITTDTFELEGEDTTIYGTFTTGTAQVITYGTTISTIRSVSQSGGDFDLLDTTTIHDSNKTQIPGLANGLTYTFENQWDISDEGLAAMKVASQNQAKRAFLFTFATGQKMVFSGYTGASLLPGGSSQEVVTTSTTITAEGVPTYYAS